MVVSGFTQYFYSVTEEQYRKNSHPVPIMNGGTVPLAVSGGVWLPIANYMNGKSPRLGSHYSIAMAAIGAWVGYYAIKKYNRWYFGKFKYCMEYAMKRKDEFPVKVSPKFGDPTYLRTWEPHR